MTSVAVAALALLLGAAQVEVQPGTARPGDAVLVSVQGAQGVPTGTLGPFELTFLEGPHGYLALLGLPVDLSPTTLALSVAVAGADGGAERIDGALEVVDPHFPRRQLRVSRRFTHPTRAQRAQAARDARAYREAFARGSRAWQLSRDFAWPRPPEITAPYGDLRLLNGQKKSQHLGTDLEGRVGDPIYAADDGVVVMARQCFASGGTVLLDHGARLFTSYFHMSSFAVKVGDHVTRGQLLGAVGRSGRVTGPHLHWGAKLDGRWVDPQSLLRLSFEGR